MRTMLFVLPTMLLWAVTGLAQPLLPWQHWVEKPDPAGITKLGDFITLPWASTGGKEGVLSLSQENGPWGGRYFDFKVEIDHFNAGPYPQGWPAFEVQPKPNLDWSGYDAVQYWVRCDTAIDRPVILRFILWTNDVGRLNTPISGIKVGEWVQVTHRLNAIPDLNKVDRVHFFLCESDYHDKDELDFKIGGFQLCKLQKEVSKLGPDEAAMGLWVGQRADTGDEAVILDQGTKTLPALLVVETGTGASLRADDELRVRFHEVFSGKESSQVMKLGQDAPAGKVSRLTTQFPIGRLAPGYYLAVADVRRGGKSLLGGRVGSDDLYITKPGESMTYTVLSIRTGMVMWCRDLLYGDVMGGTRIALPHVYDPLDKGTYPQFVTLFAGWTGKHSEGNEAGDTGLVLAAEAFRKSGDMVRCKFAEWLLDDSLNHMMEKMQSPSGGTITWANELGDHGIGESSPSEAFGSYDSNQIGEWMRPFAYAIIYYHSIPEKRAYAKKLNAACRKAADYLIAHSLQTSDGLPSVLRHLRLNEKPDGTVEQVTYQQEGRQCDVYLGRALAGLSYYAYAMQLLGDKVPDSWWPALDNTVEWCARKMKPNGWFDWQCEDIVEGGCHTFLGNIYVAEGMFGCYLADRLAGRTEQAKRAAEGTRKAYRYVTDDCWIKGVKYEYPTEFWVGPYVYWLFTEYLDTVGPDERFEDWLTVLDRKWSVDLAWHPFLDRDPGERSGVGRTGSNGMLAVAILGYLGIKQMAEVGKPLHWEAGPKHR